MPTNDVKFSIQVFITSYTYFLRLFPILRNLHEYLKDVKSGTTCCVQVYEIIKTKILYYEIICGFTNFYFTLVGITIYIYIYIYI